MAGAGRKRDFVKLIPGRRPSRPLELDFLTRRSMMSAAPDVVLAEENDQSILLS